MKPPALRFSPELADGLARAAAARQVRLHLDSHGTEHADASNAMLEVMAAHLPGEALGTTLPGRWRRSLADADWAVERGLNVRVVKGQWPDPADPQRDLSGGFLKVIDRLAGRARHVAVATHDFPLACEAIRRLQVSGTPCGVEVLLGMPARPLLRWAKESGVPVRVYIPFGAGFIPNALGVLKRNPRIALAVTREYVRTAYEFVRAAPRIER
jgi:proline dehydrogenase